MSTLDARLNALVERDRDHVCQGYGPDQVCVRIVAVANLPSRFGDFRIVAFWNNRDQKDHIAIIHGNVIGAEEVATRLHSECLTGDVLGSLRCDCRDQLETALARIGQLDRGLVLYMRQEGRGIGLATTRSGPMPSRTRALTRWRPTSPWASGTTSATTQWPHT